MGSKLTSHHLWRQGQSKKFDEKLVKLDAPGLTSIGDPLFSFTLKKVVKSGQIGSEVKPVLTYAGKDE